MHTIEAFPEGVDNREVITGATTDEQVKWTPLIELDCQRGTLVRGLKHS